MLLEARHRDLERAQRIECGLGSVEGNAARDRDDRAVNLDANSATGAARTTGALECVAQRGGIVRNARELDGRARAAV